ncbi:EF-hand domain-containing protein [Octadecabacter sp. 1_MG-2023]|uniref:EF-hand domain-containing protein n=1 Tax=unclassified Octadecabacter TaxID=196158 RepID=UPI001C0958E0|nr:MULTISPECIES: EF-hand domain-containing protein [unclassified Octadecabacter]MBU2991842.1 EF-hand domain-containing protein [Octadecabacter sp. B2R22]MDO6735816.1 EF-hand domain-containing protein [Octadecabacter sp. 1_MG-2023]
MLRTLTIVLTLAAPAAFAQGTPGGHFVENWDLDGDATVTLEEITERRDMVFNMFDNDENDLLNAEEYAQFDETRAADMEANAGGHGNGNGGGRMMEGMTLTFNDTDGDGNVTREEFVAGSTGWFAMLDKNEDGSVTSADFGPGSH